ncbi:MAG TPA: site-2 protease family protein [Candidatus Acidoferrum sp.]|nr:site-2 protease family protein [Candidatus Acidoferrum sp.]
MAQSKNSMKAFYSNLAVVAIFVLAFAAIVFCYYANFLSVPTRAILAIAMLMLSGTLIQRVKSLKGGYGMYMYGSERGIKTIDGIAKRNVSFWKQMATWGLVMGFGLLTFPLLKGKISRKGLIFGIVSIILFLYFVIPCIDVPFQFIKIAAIQNVVGSGPLTCTPTFAGLSLLGISIYVFTVVAGFSGFIIASVLGYGAKVLWNISGYAIGALSGAPQTSLLTSLVPGVAPIIPGIDIPLIAGICSFIVILTIHEFSHGILARISKIKIKSIGVLFFGVIPIGAYVEPDEKAVSKLDKEQQNRISIAGVSSNLIASIVFFALMFAMLAHVVPYIYQNQGVFITSIIPNTPANGILVPGMQILSWDGQQVTNSTNLAAATAGDLPGSVIKVVTNNGSYSFTAVAINGSARGYIGIYAAQEEEIVNTAYAHLMYFFYTFFALSFILNFLIGVVNLLPIPGFDGFRVYKTNIKSAFFVRFVTALILIGLALNALPWLFTLIH